MVKPAEDERLTLLQSLFCGGIAGVLSRTVTSPLEVVKVLSQVGTPELRFGFIRSFNRIYQREGLKAFWKGNGINCLRLVPYSAVQLAAFHNLLAALEDPHMIAHIPINVNGKTLMMAGSGSVFIAALLVYPADMLKTRLIVQNIKPTKLHYRGILHGFRTVWKSEGFLALYKGLLPTILGVIPFAGGSYLAYSLIDNSITKPPEDQLTPVYVFVSGCLATAVAKTLSFPFDTIRTKMQAKSKTLPNEGGVDIKVKGMTSAFVQTVKVNGITGLWRGLTAYLLKIVPNAGIMFLSFEYSKRVCLFYNGYTESPFSDVPKLYVDQSMSPNELRHHHSKKKAHGK